jgi:hypothetical protein
MTLKLSKKRARSSIVFTTPSKQLRISAKPPPTPEPSQSWERQQLESQPQESISTPTEGSHAGAIETTDATENTYIDNRGDDYDGIDWDRFGRRYIKPLKRSGRPKSWIYAYGYRVVRMDSPTRVFRVCKYCHIHKAAPVIIESTKATSSAASHLAQPIKGHNFRRASSNATPTPTPSSQLSIREALASGFEMPQSTANAMSNFSVQRFRHAVVLWLLDNNLPMELINRATTRELFRLANTEAEAALWRSLRSVATYAMRLFHHLQPRVVDALSRAVSIIHVSFDGWTTKGGTRGFFGIVAHFAASSGELYNLPVALPQLTGAHTGEAIAAAVVATHRAYRITSSNLGYCVLDNATQRHRDHGHLKRVRL